MAFLPSNIKAPSDGGGGGGNYMRFSQGENKFELLEVVMINQLQVLYMAWLGGLMRW